MSDRQVLNDLPGHIAEEFHRILPDLRHCEGVAGKFDVRRLERRSMAAPAVMVSILRILPGERLSGHHQIFKLAMGAFVVTKDAMGLPRDAAAAAITQAICLRVAGTSWGRDDCGAAEELRGEAIVTKQTEDAAVSIWAVTWLQPAVFAGIEPGQPVPIQLYVGQAPDIGPGHEDDYHEVGRPG